jgi:hypothetical protein
MRFIPFIIIFLYILHSSASYASDVRVKSYRTKKGTNVTSYHRTAPGYSKYKNYSTKGNKNPYTGKKGTKKPF